MENQLDNTIAFEKSDSTWIKIENPSPEVLTTDRAFIVKNKIKELKDLGRDPENPDLWPEDFKWGVDMAREYVNKLRLQLGLPEVDKEFMLVALMEDSDYRFVTSDNSGISGGAYSIGLDEVLIRDASQLGIDLKIEEVVHELVHKWIDLKVITKGKRFANTARTGLSISRYDQENSQKKNKFYGLNELGNYYFQSKFWEQIDGNIPETVKKSIERRKANISRERVPAHYLGVKSIYVDFDFDIYPDCMRYSSNDELLRPASIQNQLITELDEVCSTEEGKTFGQWLLESKVNPQHKIHLKNMVVGKLGGEFWKQLSNFGTNPKDPHDLKDTLVELQSIRSNLFDNRNI